MQMGGYCMGEVVVSVDTALLHRRREAQDGRRWSNTQMNNDHPRDASHDLDKELEWY